MAGDGGYSGITRKNSIRPPPAIQSGSGKHGAKRIAGWSAEAWNAYGRSAENSLLDAIVPLADVDRSGGSALHMPPTPWRSAACPSFDNHLNARHLWMRFPQVSCVQKDRRQTFRQFGGRRVVMPECVFRFGQPYFRIGKHRFVVVEQAADVVKMQVREKNMLDPSGSNSGLGQCIARMTVENFAGARLDENGHAVQPHKVGGAGCSRRYAGQVSSICQSLQPRRRSNSPCRCQRTRRTER